MKFVVTEITQDLTAELLQEAQQALKNGQKVFYIVPSSMSFEKEKEILSRLGAGQDTAVFDLLVTRFKQLPYYFDRKERTSDKVELSSAGLAMLFRKVLKSFTAEQLPLYHSLADSSGFLEMLVNLRAELISSNLTEADLPASPKNDELKIILTAFEEELLTSYANFDEFTDFVASISEDKFTVDLHNTIIIIDGYTRFSAEEESFITAIESWVSQLIIGTYANKQDFYSVNSAASVYQSAIELIQHFQQKFAATVEFRTSSVNKVYTKLTRLIEQENNFTLANQEILLNAADKEAFEIWQAENQITEIEKVAIEIRQSIAQGAKFKDFTVLVGNVDSYAIPVQEIFSLYEIPFFYAREEAMTHHPLIIFLESLYAIKKNNYRTNDVINLLKSKVYSTVNLEQNTLDEFEYYISKYKIQGRRKFATAFSENDFAQLEEVEKLRADLFGEDTALQKFLSDNTAKTGKVWVTNFQNFLQASGVLDKMNDAYAQAELEDNHRLADKHEQVWKLFLSNLTEFLAIFDKSKMKILDFLDILLAGVKNANYRQIPANVDVVNVKDYELVEARTNKYVYALGLNLTNFPRIKQNSTLLSDEERDWINQHTAENQFIEQVNVTNTSKSNFTILSLVNAATEKLVLSTPQIYENAQDEITPVLQLFIEHSENACVKTSVNSVNFSQTLELIGTQRALIATIGKIEQQLQDETNLSEEKYSFWSSMLRILTKESSDFQKLIGRLDQDISPVNLTEKTVKEIYRGQIYASVSSFERFYNCEYQYFIENTLGLESFENIDINSKVVGNFFHEVFENLLVQPTINSQNFDDSLAETLAEVSKNYARYFKRDALARFTWDSLSDIVKQTAVMLKASLVNPEVSTLSTETSFGLPQSELGNFQVDNISLRGRIDRIDQFFSESLGAIDYKSSQHSFKLSDVYDGTSLQFLTYLDVLGKRYPSQDIWGALYLQIKNNPIELNKLQSLAELDSYLKKDMSYEGILLADYQDEISKELDFINVAKNNVYSRAEFSELLKLNQQHYRQAGQRLLAGELAINPIMQRSKGIDRTGNVQGCRFCPLKSICRFEANTHMKETREIATKNRKAILAEIQQATGEVKNV